MSNLNTDQKRLIVRRLAVMDRPREVKDVVEERYDVEVSYSQLTHYNPTLSSGQELSEELTELFWETRRQFLEEQQDIAIAHKAKRLRELEKMHENLKKKVRKYDEEEADDAVVGLLSEIRDVLEQAAKEAGDKYSNRKEISGPDGGPVETANVEIDPSEADGAEDLVQMYQNAFLSSDE